MTDVEFQPKVINEDKLAEDMIAWRKLQMSADELGKSIENRVLQIGHSVTVGSVRCTYSNPRTETNYQMAALSVYPSEIEIAARSKTVVDWKALALELGVDVSPWQTVKGEATAKIKLLEGA